MIGSLIASIPATLKGEKVSRMENCRICGSHSALLIGKTEYWDLGRFNLVKCNHCSMIQLDPMPDKVVIDKGCLAYYTEESLRVSKKEQKRNHVRNFRRGVLFAWSLQKKKIHPRDILELGPGSGYFSAGIRFIFPDIQITVMDVNNEVLSMNHRHHGYSTIRSVPDDYEGELNSRFDLIIARDILEHVTDISKVIDNIVHYLKPGGIFHFITPNGHEDVWKHYLTWKETGSFSELLINHVNYFDGKGLKDFLVRMGLVPLDYHTYKIKTTLKGKGWKKAKKLMTGVSLGKSADHFIKDHLPAVRAYDFHPHEVLDKWYIRQNMKLLTCIVSAYHHAYWIKVPPKYNVGHEIFGLFRKPEDSPGN